MTADQVIAALRKRHPDLSGEWLTYAECWYIDLFALRCWQSGPGHVRVAYEVKVSRSDFAAELVKPGKRANALDVSNEFYFATPKGLVEAREVPEECGLLWVYPSGQTKIVRPAPKRRPRPFTMAEVIYLARFPLYRDGIAEMAAELGRLRWEQHERELRQKRRDFQLDVPASLF